MHQIFPSPVAKAQMLIRRPVAEVFAALVDPAITTHFWFTRSSGPIEAGRHLRWDWEMYGVGVEVEVQEVEKNRRVLFEWNGPAHPTSVLWTFDARSDDRTFVQMKNWGFLGDAGQVLAQVIDATGGWSFLLANLKAHLEHGIDLHLMVDHDPEALVAEYVAG
jgi:uncharacterized protein YndB with AHSA1/START domain